MIRREYETVIALGGNLSFEAVIQDYEDEIKECVSYKTIETEEEKKIVLDKVVKQTIAQDYVLLVHSIHKLKRALQEGDHAQAEKIACNIFYDRRSS